MSYKGKYYPSYPRKYKGDPTNIIYRSLWERKFLIFVTRVYLVKYDSTAGVNEEKVTRK